MWVPREIPKLELWGRALRLRTQGAGLCKGFPSWAGTAAGRAPGHPWGTDVRARCPCRAHLAVGYANAGHLPVQFVQLSLELLQLLPLGAHTLVVLTAGGRLARCGWPPVPGTLPVRPPTEAPLSPSIPHPIFHLTVSISLGSYWKEGGTRYKDCSSPIQPLAYFSLEAARLKGLSF